MDLVICGPESSGNHLFRDLFNKHPEVSKALGRSFPCSGLNGKRGSQFPEIYKIYDNTNTLILVFREKNITESSWGKHGYYKAHPHHLDWNLIKGKIKDSINAWNGKVVFASYDMLILLGEMYLRHLFQQVGLDPDNYNYSNIKVKDENKKHYERKN